MDNSWVSCFLDLGVCNGLLRAYVPEIELKQMMNSKVFEKSALKIT